MIEQRVTLSVSQFKTFAFLREQMNSIGGGYSGFLKAYACESTDQCKRPDVARVNLVSVYC